MAVKISKKLSEVFEDARKALGDDENRYLKLLVKPEKPKRGDWWIDTIKRKFYLFNGKIWKYGKKKRELNAPLN